MNGFSTQGFLLRRIVYGESDLIITFFSVDQGKVTVIAKSAKKSRKRFGGILEPFSLLKIVCGTGRRSGMPVLQEAALVHPFARIRTDVSKTGFASYWAEIINEWSAESEAQPDIYRLFYHVLDQLDQTTDSGAGLSILFQLRFLTHAGLKPNLERCTGCKAAIDAIPQARVGYDLSRGGLICGRCGRPGEGRHSLSKGAVKLMLWIQRMALDTASRTQFSPVAQQESQMFLETFLPYHLGKVPKSLKVLRQIRGQGREAH